MDFPFPYLHVGLLEGITLTVHFRGRHSTVHSISYAPFILGKLKYFTNLN